MEKTEEKQEKAVQLMQQPTAYERVFQTPDGVMNMEDYLVWIGNTLVEIKQGLVG